MHPIYVLISAVRNEEAHIEKTLRSVVAQTILPAKWVIVSDESTDGTDDIVRDYAADYPWIEYVRFAQDGERNFARKVHCFRAGYERVKMTEFDIVGNLDGDVSFEADYMEFLLKKFVEQPRLGVAGTPYTEGNAHSFSDSYVDVRHVHGQIQMFRRSCFEEIGGYMALTSGGIDWVAVTTARMKGWDTCSFQEKTFAHHREMGTANRSLPRAQFQAGKKEYLTGGHPVWELLRVAFQMTRRPYFVRGFFLFLGYWSCFLKREKIPIPADLLVFHRREQMQRLRKLVADKWSRQR